MLAQSKRERPPSSSRTRLRSGAKRSPAWEMLAQQFTGAGLLPQFQAGIPGAGIPGPVEFDWDPEFQTLPSPDSETGVSCQGNQLTADSSCIA